MENGRVQSMIYAFYTGKASHAAAAPDFGRSAFDALLMALSAAERIGKHLPRGGSLTYKIVSSGGLAVNIVPDCSQGVFILDADSEEALCWMTRRVKEIVEGAAMATGTAAKTEEKRILL